MIDLNQFETKHFVVPCQTGIHADAANGKRLVFDEEKGEYVPCKKPTQYVKKKTLETYYTSVCVLKEKHLHFAVLKSNSINKHGMQWKLEFEAVFGVDGSSPTCIGSGSLHYWLFDEGSSLLSKGLLVEKDCVRLSAYRCVCELYNPTLAKVLPSNFTPLDIVKHLSQGTLETLLNPIRQLPFGVEIEFTGITRKQAIAVVSKYFNNPARFERAYMVDDEKQRIWKIVKDSSIRVEKKYNSNLFENDDYKCELVTPILSYEDIPLLQQLVRELRHAGMMVNDSCGIHVHVNGAYFTFKRLCCLVNLMADFEPILFKAVSTNPARQKWCRPVLPEYRHAINEIAVLNDSREMNATLARISAETSWYGGSRSEIRHYDLTRYRALNLHSLWEGKGIEYRLFNSTTHAGKIKAYIQLCLAITAYAKFRSDEPLPVIDKNSEKSSFCSWLKHIGLVGPEFKTARLHLLNNLKDVGTERRNVA